MTQGSARGAGQREQRAAPNPPASALPCCQGRWRQRKRSKGERQATAAWQHACMGIGVRARGCPPCGPSPRARTAFAPVNGTLVLTRAPSVRVVFLLSFYINKQRGGAEGSRAPKSAANAPQPHALEACGCGCANVMKCRPTLICYVPYALVYPMCGDCVSLAAMQCKQSRCRCRACPSARTCACMHARLAKRAWLDA